MTRYYVPELRGLRPANIPDTRGLPTVLPAGIYSLTVVESMEGVEFYYTPKDNFSLPKKLYGKVESNSYRILNSFTKLNKNMGVLLQGKGGCGKTILAKHVCNEAVAQGLPVIVIPGRQEIRWLTHILKELPPVPHVIFIDEYEKLFEDVHEQETLLTVLDGVYQTKVLWLLTANDVERVSKYMLNRPSRIRYNFEYNGLPSSVVEDLVRDKLISDDEERVKEVISAMSLINANTFDTILSLIEEFNLYPDASMLDILDNFASDGVDLTITNGKLNLTIDGKSMSDLLTCYLPEIDEATIIRFLNSCKLSKYASNYTLLNEVIRSDGRRYDDDEDDFLPILISDRGEGLICIDCNTLSKGLLQITSDKKGMNILDIPFNSRYIARFTNELINYSLSEKLFRFATEMSDDAKSSTDESLSFSSCLNRYALKLAERYNNTLMNLVKEKKVEGFDPIGYLRQYINEITRGVYPIVVSFFDSPELKDSFSLIDEDNKEVSLFTRYQQAITALTNTVIGRAIENTELDSLSFDKGKEVEVLEEYRRLFIYLRKEFTDDMTRLTGSLVDVFTEVIGDKLNSSSSKFNLYFQPDSVMQIGKNGSTTSKGRLKAFAHRVDALIESQVKHDAKLQKEEPSDCIWGGASYFPNMVTSSSRR